MLQQVYNAAISSLASRNYNQYMSKIALQLFSFLLATAVRAHCQSVPEQHIIQQMLDLPELQQYYHADILNRLPIKLLENESAPRNLRLQKFDFPVLILSASELKKQEIKDYVSIHKIVSGRDTLMYNLGYSIEGVVCRVRFIKQHAVWKIQNYYLAEQ
ncbi:hypothetical protein [Hymenobacter norwichensis]|uniref:hypothetical protein n=1 Tax=Hymenobacter norwichensis TaxID=223903 RepID=UPI0003B6CCD0|nr:hypothetical protein [Hymenobacter norwichensis]